MNIVFGVLIGFFILMALVVAHEFGHFIAARRSGVEVEEFGIGFPPRAKAWIMNPEYIAWKKAKKSGKKPGKKPKKWLKLQKSEWDKKQKTLVFSINYLPIGGFCQMKGESDSDKRPHSFGQATLWQKTKILFAGVAMNWLVAFIILTVLSITGMPEFMENQFHMPGDSAEAKVDIDEQYYIPVTRSTWSAPIVGAVTTVQLTGETYRGLFNMLTSLGSGIVKQFNPDESIRNEGQAEIKDAGDSVSGPVGIIGIIFPKSFESGPTTLAFLAALISISLACMNVLPIPALDGGRFIMIAFYRLRGKVLTKEKEEKLVARTFIFLLILIAIVTILDVTRFFR